MYQVAADADAGEKSDMQAAMVKFMASEMSERVTSEALQIHGGAGYTTDFPIERYWRDARLTKIFEGTSEIMQRLIADHLLPRRASDDEPPMKVSTPHRHRQLVRGLHCRAAHAPRPRRHRSTRSRTTTSPSR